MFHFFKRTLYPLCLLLFLIVAVIFSCDNKDKDFTIGSDFIESDSRIVLLDTFTAELSTIALDSFITSGKGVALCGRYEDTIFGKVTCKSFFQYFISEFNVNQYDVYDSTILTMTLNGYSYGDTTRNFCCSVFPVTESMLTDESESYYNNTNFSYGNTPLGHACFLPHPNEKSAVRIKIDDDFGENLWEQVKENSTIFSSYEIFASQYPGLVLVSSDDNKVILGFNAYSGQIDLTIYSHRIGNDIETIVTEFSLSNYEYQFNRFETDFSKTLLKDKFDQYDDIPSTVINNQAFIQGGTGMSTKISFPYLGNVLLLENAKLIRAELLIKPHENSYISFDFPDSLILSVLDRNNYIVGTFYDSEGNLIISDFKYDEFYHEDTYYHFDVTYFLMSELEDSYVDPEQGFGVILHPDYAYTTLERVILKGGEDYPKLKLYFLYY